jgi:hypothetical protein
VESFVAGSYGFLGCSSREGGVLGIFCQYLPLLVLHQGGGVDDIEMLWPALPSNLSLFLVLSLSEGTPNTHPCKPNVMAHPRQNKILCKSCRALIFCRVELAEMVTIENKEKRRERENILI